MHNDDMSGKRPSVELVPLRPRPSSARVADSLRRLITLGAVAPGERLPSERDLAETLRVGRDSIRMAIRTLNDEKLVETRLGRTGGTFVTDKPRYEQRLSAEVLASHRDIRASYEFRLAVEPAAAFLAAQRRDAQAAHAIAAIAEETAWSFRSWRAIDGDSHRRGRGLGQLAAAGRREQHARQLLRLVGRHLLAHPLGIRCPCRTATSACCTAPSPRPSCARTPRARARSCAKRWNGPRRTWKTCWTAWCARPASTAAASGREARAPRRTRTASGAVPRGEVPAADLHPLAQATRLRRLVDVVRRGQVLYGDAQRLEQRDLVRRSAYRGLAREHLADLAHDVAVVDEAFAARDEELAGLVEQRLALRRTSGPWSPGPNPAHASAVSRRPRR